LTSLHAELDVIDPYERAADVQRVTGDPRSTREPTAHLDQEFEARLARTPPGACG
jgi:hypothetical protein